MLPSEPRTASQAPTFTSCSAPLCIKVQHRKLQTDVLRSFAPDQQDQSKCTPIEVPISAETAVLPSTQDHQRRIQSILPRKSRRLWFPSYNYPLPINVGYFLDLSSFFMFFM